MKSAPKKTRHRKGSSSTTRRSKKTTPAGKPSAMAARRADFGAPIDDFFTRQSPQLRPILEELRTMVEKAAPDADSSIKWGMPFYTVNGTMMCALGAHKSHVNLVLAGPPGAFADPEGRLEGEARGGRHLKLRTLEELPREAVRGWLRTAAELARNRAAYERLRALRGSEAHARDVPRRRERPAKHGGA